MKEKGLLAKPSAAYQNHLPTLPEDKVSVSYEVSNRLLFFSSDRVFNFLNLEVGLKLHPPEEKVKLRKTLKP